MAQNNSLKETTERNLNPGQTHADSMLNGQALNAREQSAWDDMTGDNYKNNDSKESQQNPTEIARSKETRGDGQWVNKTNGSRATSKPSGNRLMQFANKAKGFAKKPAGIMSIIGGGGLVSFMALLAFLVPNQLKMATEVITAAASSIPEYAMQQRGEYLATRFLATRVLALSGDNVNEKLIFCNNGSITCSLASTKFAEAFDKKYGLVAKPTVSGSTITVKPAGRSGLGGKAVSWNVEYSRTGSVDGKLRSITTSIKTHKEMVKFIKSDVKRVHNKNYITRHIAKRILMKRYGVTHFRAFEKTRNKIAFKNADLKAKIAVNTVGKIMPKIPAYLACLQGNDTMACQRTLSAASDLFDKKISDIDKQLSTEGITDAERERLTTKKDGYSKLKAGLGAPELEGKLGKMVSKNILTKVAGPVALASVFDLVFEVIEGLDDKAIELVSYDVMSQGYLGFAYGDEVGVVPNVDQFTVEGNDMATLGLMTQMFDGMGESALYQVRTGQSDYDQSKTYTNECEADGGRKIVRLPVGDLVCPEEKMVKSYTEFTNSPYWPIALGIAKAWNASAGKLFDVIDAVFGFVLGPFMSFMGQLLGFMTSFEPIASWKDFTAEKFAEVIQWIFDMAFGIPDFGPGGSGTASYVALDGAITKSFNDTMENGIDSTNGEVMGAGGRILSSPEKFAIDNSALNDEREEFNKKPVLAKIFDGNLRGSVISKLAIVSPTKASGFLSLAPKLLGSIPSVLSTNSYAASGVYNPHGFPLYGYGPGDVDVFEANPDQYNETFCTDSAKKREDSYTVKQGDKLPSYSETDPCALEKIVVGAMLDEAGITDDENYIKEPDSEQMVVGTDPATDPTIPPSDEGGGLVDAPSKDGWVNPVQPAVINQKWHNAYSGKNGQLHKGIDFKGGRGTPVYAAHDGTVTLAKLTKTCGWSTIITAEGVNGIWHAYQHMKPTVTVGDVVKAGQRIGAVGDVCGTGPHLHFSIETANRYSAYPDGPTTDTSRNPKDYLPL